MSGGLDKQQTERTPCKCFRCGYLDHLIAKCRKLPKDLKKNGIPSVSMKGVIVHSKYNPRTVKMITVKIYMHLWHECMVMKIFY